MNREIPAGIHNIIRRSTTCLWNFRNFPFCDKNWKIIPSSARKVASWTRGKIVNCIETNNIESLKTFVCNEISLVRWNLNSTLDCGKLEAVAWKHETRWKRTTNDKVVACPVWKHCKQFFISPHIARHIHHLSSSSLQGKFCGETKTRAFRFLSRYSTLIRSELA